MELRQALEILNSYRTNELVIVPFTGSVVWEQISTRPELDLPFWGSMGKAASTGLGIALAMPNLRVWVLDGDGSLLMNLGTLVTEIQMAPPNLVHIVLQNGVYATTGGQPIPGKGKTEFPYLARAAGFVQVYDYADPYTMQRGIGDALREEGPVFINLRVDPFIPDGLPKRLTKQAVREVWETLRQLNAETPAAS